MPARVRAVVARLVAETRREGLDSDDPLSGYCLGGGPTGCLYLDQDGDVWDWCGWEDTVRMIEDGPEKVSVIALAAEFVPELAEWLPRRPAHASECPYCQGGGRLKPPLPPIQCFKCNGLGWLEPDGSQ
jgi:hypothetical protein